MDLQGEWEEAAEPTRAETPTCPKCSKEELKSVVIGSRRIDTCDNCSYRKSYGI